MNVRDKESKTLFFVTVAFIVITLRFVFGGISLQSGGLSIQIPTSGLVDYGTAFAAVLAPWLVREWKEKAEERSQ